MRVVLPALGAAMLLASGCAANGYCTGEFAYQKAGSVPPLKNAQGLKLPESSSALKIPPPPAQTTPYAQTVKDADGDDAVACLDQPPPMPPPAPPKVAEPEPLPKSDTAPTPAAPVAPATTPDAAPPTPPSK
ncbi:MAG TPA: hypothetical protein VM369_11105 [Candidatus Binatia bacterium]|nr:hypothetical protein [Candidatus Binatia bacterium]